MLGQIIQATCDPGDEVVFAWRSFEAYPIVTALAGATAVQVPLDEHAATGLDAMLEAVTERTRVVLVCTPNNPTGPSSTTTSSSGSSTRCPRDVLVVIDEAYLDSSTTTGAGRPGPLPRPAERRASCGPSRRPTGWPASASGMPWRTSPWPRALRKTAVPFGVNSLAQAAAVASLAAFDELKERVDALVAERTRVVEALRMQGWFIPETQANFVWFPSASAARPSRRPPRRRA